MRLCNRCLHHECRPGRHANAHVIDGLTQAPAVTWSGTDGYDRDQAHGEEHETAHGIHGMTPLGEEYGGSVILVP